MTLVSCSIDEQFVNPLFEVFDGGDFVLSSYRDVESDATEIRIFFEDESEAPAAIAALKSAGEIVGVSMEPVVSAVPDEDWKFAYRRHFKTEVISPRLVIHPPWEEFTPAPGQKVLTLDPGMAFGTGQHATTRACLEYIDKLAVEDADRSFLDVGCGSGILAIAAALEGFSDVHGFDIDPDAVAAANENAEKNDLSIGFYRGDLMKPERKAKVVAANVLGPILIRFAKEIEAVVEEGSDSRLILSGILEEIYDDVKCAYEAVGFKEIDSVLKGEWKTGLFARV